MLSRIAVLCLVQILTFTGASQAGELGAIARPLFDALNALRASKTVPAPVVAEELRRLGRAYHELTSLDGSVALSGGLKTMMAGLGTRYGELLEERARLEVKLRASNKAGTSNPYRDGSAGDEAKLEQVTGELRTTLEKALLVPYFLRNDKVTIEQLQARSRSENISLLTLIGSLVATGTAAGLTDVFAIGHGSVVLQTWGVATAVFFGIAALKPGSIRSWLVVKPALRAMQNVFTKERGDLFEAFTESAGVVSETARAISGEVGAGFDFVTRGLSQASPAAEFESAAVRSRVCEFEVLTPEQRVRVGEELEAEPEPEPEIDASPGPARHR